MFQSLTPLSIEDKKEGQVLFLLVMYNHQKSIIPLFLFAFYKLNGNFD
ncbi:hypothetical protein SK578_2020 [Streptococcus mitis]|uniref:Uncharacterized protein n=1 Tax=Streptococcus mitis TaxID=28037 RepID=A0A081QKF8_STRMT|nr:hypothetical protein SK578_2020 [Streptococcus mitis]